MRLPFLRPRWFGLALLPGLLLFTVACNNPGNTSEGRNEPAGETSQRELTDAPVPFQIVETDGQKLAELQEKPAGAYWVTVDGNNYLVVTAGQKPTAGYTLVVESVTYDGTALKVKAQLLEPNPGEMVAQVITYPMAVLSIADESFHQAPAAVEWITDVSPPAN